MQEMSASFDPHLVELFQSTAEDVLEEDARRAATHRRDLVG